MNNEPVAWLSPDNFYVCPEAEYEIKITTEHPKDLGWLPLYTHPAKTLTDEEIHKVDREVLNEFNGEDYVLRFARAILRKAQEK
jgi:hypothetical protein